MQVVSKEQAVGGLSTLGGKYVVLNSATQIVVWLKNIDGVISQVPMVLMEENQGAIAITKNPVGHARAKHIDICYQSIDEAAQNGILTYSTVQQKRL